MAATGGSVVRTLATRLVFIATVLVDPPGRCAVAAPLFDSSPSFQLPVSALTLALDDLNHDGKADLATINGSSQVSIRLSAGAGTFRPSVEYTTGPNPSQVVIVDVNGDGNPDLVTGNAGTVSVLLGNGDGTFRAHVDYPSAGAGLAVGDVNGDGKPDIVTTSTVLLGNGDGTCQAKRDYLGGNRAVVAIGDLNGDGYADLVTASSDTFSVFLSHGDGTFEPRSDYPRGYAAAAFRRAGPARSPRSKDSPAYFGNSDWIALGDVNGDGKLDLALVNSDCCQFVSTVAVQLGRGDGTFQPRVDFKTEDYPSYVAIGDVNGDGHPDIVTANDYSYSVSVLLGHGDGTFAHRTNYEAWGRAFSVGIGDVNGDGTPDLVEGSMAPLPSSVFLGNGDGTFQASAAYECGRIPFDLAIADFDGDGKLDVTTVNWDMDRISILYGNGDGSLQDRVDYVIGWNYHYVAVGDVNGDGRPDLLFVNDNGTTSILLSNGDRTFRRTPDVPTPDGFGPIALRDVNGDGKGDLVSMGMVLLGNGDGSFGAALPFDAGGGYAFVLGDLNGDSRLDLIAANTKSNTISVLLGNGDGTFQPRVTYATAPGPLGIAIADLNGDGKLDIVTTGTPFASVLLGNGDGTFRAHVDYGTIGGSYAIAVADLNGDGKPDLVTNAMSVLLGHGDGTFGPATSYGPGGTLVAVGDLDRDGAPDIVTAAYEPYHVLVHRNVSTRATVLSARVAFDPRVINLRNNAPWLTAYIQPVGFSASDIEFSSLRLGGSIPPSPKFARVGDRDGNGLPELAIKFSREAIGPLLTVGVHELELTGRLVTGESFHGSGQVRVIEPHSSVRPTVVAPNPLNPRGSLSFYVARAGAVRIRVFDRGGRLVRTILDDPAVTAGPHDVAIDGRTDRNSPLASGVYFYKIETSGVPVTGRFVVLK